MSDLCLGTLDPLQLVPADLDDSIPQELTDYTEEDMDKVCPLPPAERSPQKCVSQLALPGTVLPETFLGHRVITLIGGSG